MTLSELADNLQNLKTAAERHNYVLVHKTEVAKAFAHKNRRRYNRNLIISDMKTEANYILDNPLAGTISDILQIARTA